MTDVVIGLVAAVTLGALGLYVRHATKGGALTLVAATMLAFVLGGWVWGAPVVVFLVSDLAVTRFRASQKHDISERFAHNGQRDAVHVLARLGWAYIVLIVGVVTHLPALYIAFVGALATATADVWSAELGVLSPKQPRLITTGQLVRPGSAGAVSALGLIAALVGSWLIGLSGLVVVTLQAWLDKTPTPGLALWLPIASTVGGLIGCLTDSLFGAAAQGMYYCEVCNERSERPVHHCGHGARQIRGWAWFSNEGVNWVSSVVGAAAAMGLAEWLAQLKMRW